MKLKVFSIIIAVLILSSGLTNVADDVSRVLVNHTEVGNFINADEIETDKITMLHWFSQEVQVYSEKNKELYFVVFQPYNGLTMYKNKKLIMQNESDQYPKYQSGNYMIFHIESEDYLANRVDLYSDVTVKNANHPTYSGNYFLGNYSNINKLIVTKNTIDVLTKCFIIFVGVMVFFTEKNRWFSILLIPVLGLVFVGLELGLLAFVVLLYVYASKQQKKSVKKVLLIMALLVACLLPYVEKWLEEIIVWIPVSLNSLYLFIFLMLSIVNYLKDKSSYSLIAMLDIATIFLFFTINYEFMVFRLFYNELFITIIVVTLLALSFRNFRIYFSKEKTVRLDLLRGISHDLRVPISTISLNAEILEKDDFTSDINKNTILHIIKGATQDLTDMTNSLTTYMSQDGYVKSRFKSSLQDSIYQTTRYYLNNEKNIDVKINTCEEEIYLSIEEVWLNRLIYNIVDNAYKYTDEYGEITISLLKNKKKVVFSVEDNGIGMSKEDIERILEPFYRVDKSRGTSGLGLGLSIVKSIVDNLEGQIRISSSLGEGTNFTIEI